MTKQGRQSAIIAGGGYRSCAGKPRCPRLGLAADRFDNPPRTADGRRFALVPASLYQRPPVVTRRHACLPPAVVSAACAVATIQPWRALQAFRRIREGGLAAEI